MIQKQYDLQYNYWIMPKNENTFEKCCKIMRVKINGKRDVKLKDILEENKLFNQDPEEIKYIVITIEGDLSSLMSFAEYFAFMLARGD